MKCRGQTNSPWHRVGFPGLPVSFSGCLLQRWQREAAKAGKALGAHSQQCCAPASCPSPSSRAGLKQLRRWGVCLQLDPFSFTALFGHPGRISLRFHPISGFRCFEGLGTVSSVYTPQSCTNSRPLPSLVTSSRQRRSFLHSERLLFPFPPSTEGTAHLALGMGCGE